MRLGSRRFRFIGLFILMVVVIAGVAVVLQQKGGDPQDALANADSTGVSGDSAQKMDRKGDEDEEKEPPPVPVEIEKAAPHDIPAYFHATGSIEAKRQVDLISKAQGQVVSLRVEEGDFVREGQILLEIDHREDELLVEQARVKAEVAERELDRMEGLTEKGLGSDREFQEKRELAEVATLEHRLAQVRRDNKIVRAPFSGQITLRHIEVGQTVNVGEPLVAIADVSPMEVRLYLPEKIVKTLGTGQPVEIRSDAARDHTLVGRVSRIAPAVDPATSTVKVTLEVDNPEGAVRVGSFVRGRITTDVHRDVVAVPKKALVPEAGVTYLFVASGDSVHKVAVTTGYTDDEYIEITKGIDLGDTVITVGQGGLRQGSKIRNLAAEREADVADATEAQDSSQEEAN